MPDDERRTLAVDRSLGAEDILTRLENLSGIEQLRKILDEQFFARGHILRCFRIMHDAMRLLSVLKYERLPQLRQAARDAEAQGRRFSELMAQVVGARETKRELLDFIKSSLASRVAAPRQAEETLEAVDRVLAITYRELEEHNADFEALQRIANASDEADSFAEDEKLELEPLFGRYGVELMARLPQGRAGDLKYIMGRQQFWNQRFHRERSDARRLVAEAAVTRYGLILADLNDIERA
jgi:hypothetical protein